MYNDITESFTEQLENNEITPTEAGFMRGEKEAELGDEEDGEEDE